MRITCSCGQPLQVNDALVGKRVKCPQCGEAVLVREEGVSPTPARASTAPGSPREEDSPPPRERRWSDEPDEDAPAPTRGVSVLGVISLVLGILGALIAMIPCIGMFVGGPAAGLGLLLGLIGLIVALKTKRSGMGMPIAGSVVSFLGLCIAGAWLAISTLWVQQVKQDVEAQAVKMEQENKAIREGPASEVTAAALQKAYGDNPIAADRKYKGQVLVVKGQVERVTRAGAEATVELKTDEEGETVDCEFALGQKASLAELKPGQQVTIRGRCKGQEDGSLTLENCILSRGMP